MAQIVYLPPGDAMPVVANDQPWLFVEAAGDGQFFGSGAAWKQNGEWVGYCSLVEDDHSLDTAMAAAEAWAGRYGVQTIWVQTTP